MLMYSDIGQYSCHHSECFNSSHNLGFVRSPFSIMPEVVYCELLMLMHTFALLGFVFCYT
jgi:hypothetical protein